jgi:5'-3' exonuclease
LATVEIALNSQEIPGEGEHKNMEHIRKMKHQPGHEPNSRHRIYGQDADLIMLEWWHMNHIYRHSGKY